MKTLKADKAWGLLHRGSSARLSSRLKAKFTVGDNVVAKHMSHPGHIRLPEYVQGCEGTILASRGTFVFPDASAAGRKEPQHLYTVRFESNNIWNKESQVSDVILVDLFEPYLKNA